MALGGGNYFQQSGTLGGSAQWPSFRVDHWHLRPGPRPDIEFETTVVALLLSGRPASRLLNNGKLQTFAARPGLAWVCPVGTRDRNIEFSGPMEVLHLCLPTPILPARAATTYLIDPSVALFYAEGVADPMLAQIGVAMKDILERGAEPADRLFVDGIQVALVGHLIGKYSVDRWQPPTQMPTLDAKRLARVLEFVEARLADSLSLDDLAAEACLSSYHFTRLFREATGLSPHRYVSAQRVQAAKDKLRLNHSSLAEVALDTGCGSQANFIRVFRKATGLTPGQYRSLQSQN